MLRVNRVKAAVAAVTIAGATTAAMLVPASPAVAFSSGGLVLDIAIQSPAHLVARGAAVAVPVDYTCFGTSNAEVEVTLTERVSGGAIASGFGSTSDTTCNGEIQSVTLNVTASGTRAFTRGTAFADGNIFGCGNFCANQTESATITIDR